MFSSQESSDHHESSDYHESDAEVRPANQRPVSRSRDHSRPISDESDAMSEDEGKQNNGHADKTVGVKRIFSKKFLYK